MLICFTNLLNMPACMLARGLLGRKDRAGPQEEHVGLDGGDFIPEPLVGGEGLLLGFSCPGLMLQSVVPAMEPP